MVREDFFYNVLSGKVDFSEASYYDLLGNQKIRTLLNIMIFLYEQNEKLEKRITKLEKKKTTQRTKKI